MADAVPDRLAYKHVYRLHATDAARLVLVAAALRLVWGWTKSFPVSIGRPGLRVVVQSIEIAVFVPLLLVFAARWGATGAAGAMLISTVVFCARGRSCCAPPCRLGSTGGGHE